MKEQASFQVHMVHNGKVLLPPITFHRSAHVGTAAYHEMDPETVTYSITAAAGQDHDLSLQMVPQPPTNPDTTNPRYTLIIKRLPAQ